MGIPCKATLYKSGQNLIPLLADGTGFTPTQRPLHVYHLNKAHSASKTWALQGNRKGEVQKG